MEPVIITVNHDTPRFVELCIRAVHLRTKRPYRHIIIDNGSKHKTIKILDKFKRQGWIELYKRQIPKVSRSHAASLDWLLQLRVFGLVCLLDSDAYPVCEGWLGSLKQTLNVKNLSAIGYAHFRNEKLLHPSMMLFRYNHYMRCGRPSFAMNGNIRDNFNDTGMAVCKKLLQRGYKIKAINPNKANKLVRHRWSGTRFDIAIGNKINTIPKAEFRRRTRKWFSEKSAREALVHV